ncbi:MAG TPA: 2,3-bisphosphoglycerate-independent phosphoglycerate mutase [Bryobacteraceae bacterium]|jgi:2,3-bisphosphoglycerate-independent phosphoglycerate mutase|nr:2,3-bisphosphoglycerate-independent phosphoglycerate mutase [Bryobacteraceae bacterium]
MHGKKKPLVLTILDGWGFSSVTEGNAIAAARKPTYDSLLREYPNTLIRTSGKAVGLPEGQMGNSEVGHLNIGAGRIILMDVTRIDQMIASGDFFKNPVLLDSMQHARTHRLHLMGLCSDGGVHSLLTHLHALIKLAKQEMVPQVFVHCFMDGRDTPPESGAGFLEQIQREMRQFGIGRIASVSGRYYAMDRDQRWDRIERAFAAMVLGKGEKNADPVAALKRSYEQGITDEFVEPVTIVDDHHQPVGLIRDGDACIFFNFRADRAREMTMALTDTALEKPSRSLAPKNLHFATMTEYDKTFKVPFVLPREHPNNILADVMAQLNWKNLRVAETEKYAHVTYFFNGGNEKPYAGESRELVPSPKVATYDLQPEMSAPGVTAAVVKAIEQGDLDFIVMNYANADMVGHSGKMAATVQAVEAVDAGLGELYAALRRSGGSWIITADHGNAETMIDPVTKGPHTYHTTNPVPFILVDETQRVLRQGGALQDISPTLLGFLGEKQPKEMTGRDLRL